MARRRPPAWLLMGIISSLLSAIGCAPASGRPALPDYEVALYPRHALRIDPAAATNGRFEIVAGDKQVLELRSTRGKSAIARDTAALWTVAIELPASPDPARPLELSLDGAPSIARVAGEDVLYLARGGKGKLALARTSDPVTGEIEVVFEAPARDLIKLGSYRLAGSFKAKVK